MADRTALDEIRSESVDARIGHAGTRIDLDELTKRYQVGDIEVTALEDINRREAVVLGTLAFAVLFIGLWPAPLIELMDASVGQLLEHIVQTKLN